MQPFDNPLQHIISLVVTFPAKIAKRQNWLPLVRPYVCLNGDAVTASLYKRSGNSIPDIQVSLIIARRQYGEGARQTLPEKLSARRQVLPFRAFRTLLQVYPFFPLPAETPIPVNPELSRTYPPGIVDSHAVWHIPPPTLRKHLDAHGMDAVEVDDIRTKRLKDLRKRRRNLW
jgi:hypothetical protein